MTFQKLDTLAEHTDVYRDARRLAVIDMGSNSWRLIVVEYVPDLSFKVVDEVAESVRIGEGMAELPVLRPAAMDRGARVAQIYAAFCKSSGIDDIIAVGTSAIRDAQNQKRFLQRIERESGIRVRVASGEEEAFYGYLAAVNSTTLENGFVVDMGGGSMQISRVEDRKLIHAVSFPLGAVRVTEGFLHSDPATTREVSALADHVRAALKPIKWFAHEPGMKLIGEGGNQRLVARLIQKRSNYPLDILHGYEVERASVESVRDELMRLTISQRKRINGMKADRADISLGGATVMHEVMRYGGFEWMEICAQGLREGLFYERFFGKQGEAVDTPPMFEDVRRSSVLNLCHLYRFQEKHAEQIARLTLEMFDQIPPNRSLCGPKEREVLWAASMLHDVGVSVDYHDHHKHGSYLILNQGIPGYTHREIGLIALLVRYHRKGRPMVDELGVLLSEGDETRLLQLCALLRLAEQLDRSRDGVVRSIRISIQGNRALMELYFVGDEQVALWAVERHRDLFEQAYGFELEFVPIPVEGEG